MMPTDEDLRAMTRLTQEDAQRMFEAGDHQKHRYFVGLYRIAAKQGVNRHRKLKQKEIETLNEMLRIGDSQEAILTYKSSENEKSDRDRPLLNQN